jgi:hypothetical protein
MKSHLDDFLDKDIEEMEKMYVEKMKRKARWQNKKKNSK